MGEVTERSSAEQVDGSLYLREIVSVIARGESLSEVAKNVLEKSDRDIEIAGKENVPVGGHFIVAINHYVRVDNLNNMTGSQKMNDLMSSMGVVVKVIKDVSPNTNIVWTPSEVPRPEGLLPNYPKDKSISVFLDWLVNDSKFVVANLSRKLFLKTLASSKDVLSVPYTMEGMKGFLMNAKEKIENGEVIALFPEGEVSQELRRAKNGVSHLAISTQAKVLPIAQYDEGGKLIVKIGQPLSPPNDRKEKDGFTNRIMGSIASMLPDNLRGFYADKVGE